MTGPASSPRAVTGSPAQDGSRAAANKCRGSCPVLLLLTPARLPHAATGPPAEVGRRAAARSVPRPMSGLESPPRAATWPTAEARHRAAARKMPKEMSGPASPPESRRCRGGVGGHCMGHWPHRVPRSGGDDKVISGPASPGPPPGMVREGFMEHQEYPPPCSDLRCCPSRRRILSGCLTVVCQNAQGGSRGFAVTRQSWSATESGLTNPFTMRHTRPSGTPPGAT